jgi:hypothetical protein
MSDVDLHCADVADSLDLLATFLDGRLPFMGLKDLGGGQVAVVTNERIHAVALRAPYRFTAPGLPFPEHKRSRSESRPPHVRVCIVR